MPQMNRKVTIPNNDLFGSTVVRMFLSCHRTRQPQRAPGDSAQDKSRGARTGQGGVRGPHLGRGARGMMCAGNGVRPQTETDVQTHGGEGVTEKGQHTPTYKEVKAGRG